MSARITWPVGRGAAWYEVWRNTSNTTVGATLIGVPVLGNSYVDASAAAGTDYFYFIKVANAAGVSGFSSAIALTTRPALARPENVRCTFFGTNEWIATWDAVAGAATYKVYRGSTPVFGSATLIASGVTSLNWANAPIATDTIEYVWVVAVDGSGNNGAVSLTAAAYASPAAPGAFAIFLGALPGENEIDWNPSARATLYEIYRDGVLVHSLAAGGATIWYDTDVTPEVEYTYEVVATNSAGQATTGEDSVTAIWPAPASPENVVATDDDYDKVRVTWDAVPGALSYRVQLAGSDIATGVTALFFDYDPGAGTAAGNYTVVAVNAAGESAPSAADSGYRPQIPAPTGVTATQDDPAGVTVEWATEPLATNYDVYRDGVVIAGPITGLDYYDTGATAGCSGHVYTVKSRRVVSGVSDNVSVASAGYTGVRPPSAWLFAGGGVSGSGTTNYDETFNFCGGGFSLYFNAFTNPDAIEVYIGGAFVWSSGCISGEVTQPFTTGATTVRIKVVADCAAIGSTAWSFAVTP